MCIECHQTPCHPRCPNADEPKKVFVCSGCGDDICEGDWYYDVMGEQFCENCIEDCCHMAEVEDDYEADSY